MIPCFHCGLPIEWANRWGSQYWVHVEMPDGISTGGYIYCLEKDVPGSLLHVAEPPLSPDSGRMVVSEFDYKEQIAKMMREDGLDMPEHGHVEMKDGLPVWVQDEPRRFSHEEQRQKALDFIAAHPPGPVCPWCGREHQPHCTGMMG